MVALFLSSSYLNAMNFLSNDFRVDTNSTNFSLFLDAKSDKLTFDVFERDWEYIPSNEKNNAAHGNIYFDIYKDYDGLRLGLFSQQQADVEINNGFLQTWYYAGQDFESLLLSDNLNEKIDNLPVSGSGNHYDSYGLYIQKVLDLSDNHYLSLKLKLYISDELHNIDINGETNSSRFTAGLDYYYNKKNLITKDELSSPSSYGIGYGIDVEYIYNLDELYVYLGGFNLGSKIYYKNVTKMHFDFDSKRIYVGEDGYNHYKPFGVGYYEKDMSFVQSLKAYYKTAINYEVYDNLFLGYDLDIYSSMTFNGFNIGTQIYESKYKLSYAVENKILAFGAYFKNIEIPLLYDTKISLKAFNLELTNKFSTSGNYMAGACRVSF